MADKMTVGKLRLGSRIVFGRYSASETAEPQEITWLKASTNSDFISEFALDHLCYDAPETRNGERYSRSYSEYGLSNIHTYLNSSAKEWYYPTHEYDRPPVYRSHYGFLHYFDEEEVSCMVERPTGDGTVAMVMLPSEDEVFHGGFQLLKKKARRAHCSPDLMHTKMRYMDSSRWESVALRTAHATLNGNYRIVDTGGWEYTTSAGSCVGIRPTCRIDPSTEVKKIDDDTYELVTQVNELFSVDTLDIKAMLGLV